LYITRNFGIIRDTKKQLLIMVHIRPFFYAKNTYISGLPLGVPNSHNKKLPMHNRIHSGNTVQQRPSGRISVMETRAKWLLKKSRHMIQNKVVVLQSKAIF